MKARIKLGAGIMHDRLYGKWPTCCPPRSEYNDEEYRYQAKNPDMIFDVEWKGSVNGGYWNCISHGYGGKGYYGNGAILVDCVDGIEKLPETIKVILQKINSTEIMSISHYDKGKK